MHWTIRGQSLQLCFVKRHLRRSNKKNAESATSRLHIITLSKPVDLSFVTLRSKVSHLQLSKCKLHANFPLLICAGEEGSVNVISVVSEVILMIMMARRQDICF
jgi:hypothetical protein